MAKNDPNNPQLLDNVQALIEAGVSIGETRPSTNAPHRRSTVPYALVPKDMELTPIPVADELPSRAEMTMDLENVESFLAYVKKFKTPDTMLFANRKYGGIQAIFDYHQPTQDGTKPGFMSHRCTLKPALTPEWLAWVGCNGKKMTQDPMIEFLESWNQNIWKPDAATILEVASSIEATKACTFKSVKRLSNGQREFTYNESINATGQSKLGAIVIPEMCSLSLTRSFGQNATIMEARFRYRIEEGHLILWYDLVKLAEAEQEAFEDLCDQIKCGCGLAPLL